jgi:hypothetical protein
VCRTVPCPCRGARPAVEGKSHTLPREGQETFTASSLGSFQLRIGGKVEGKVWREALEALVLWARQELNLVPPVMSRVLYPCCAYVRGGRVER